MNKKDKNIIIVIALIIGAILFMDYFNVVDFGIFSIVLPDGTGDLDGDGVISPVDLNIMRSIVMGIPILCYDINQVEIDCKLVADLDGDTTIGPVDLNLLRNYLLQPSLIQGDLDGDGIISPADLSILQNCVQGIIDERCTLEVADLDGDGVIGPTDLSLLRDIILVEPKVVEEPIVETCSDTIQNQDETGIDCGGVCEACPVPVVSSGGGGGGSSFGGGTTCNAPLVYNQTSRQCEEIKVIVEEEKVDYWNYWWVGLILLIMGLIVYDKYKK